MVKLHLNKSQLALCLTSLDDYKSKRKLSGAEEDMYKETYRKVSKAYATAER